jgi:hypothetical protein
VSSGELKAAAAGADIVDVFLLANTPCQLYDGLRILQSVRAIAFSPSRSTLAAQFDEATSQKPLTLEGAARAYALLVALTIVEENTPVTVSRLPVSRLEWGPAIVTCFARSIRPTSVTTIGPRAVLRRNSKSSAAESLNSISGPAVTVVSTRDHSGSRTSRLSANVNKGNPS